ncbi:MAG TPA: ABC transporter permease [Kiritimatiellia bacterium]|nr:ABC transporter permease [Kiritimatiellia bacterium]
MSLVSTALAYRELLANLVIRDLKSRYRGSALGLLWTVLTPLFMALIYIFFLRLLMGRGVRIRHEEIIIGVFAWQFTIQAIQSGMNCITGNANLVKKIYFPRIIIPLSVNLSALINYLLMLVVQLGLVAVILHTGGSHLSAGTFFIPLLIVYHFMFNLSLALLTAAANVYFRDTQHFVGLFISAWFFVSPVMYSLSLLDALTGDKAWLRELYMLNPLTLIITAYRALQIPGEVFPWSIGAVIGWCWPVVIFAGALIFYQRTQRYFADWL